MAADAYDDDDADDDDDDDDADDDADDDDPHTCHASTGVDGAIWQMSLQLRPVHPTRMRPTGYPKPSWRKASDQHHSERRAMAP